MFDLPSGAAWILRRLNDCGYRAYVVGGCVRDVLLGKTPNDWDICTDALPEDMQRVFADCHVVETGLKHGTLTVVLEHEPYEVTTFRVDGGYTDHRHPDSVTFVSDLTADLARRDFTVNAMAYHPDEGVVDAFGGRDDLRAGVIRCVGEAMRRFDEDALRILRALRFASTYGFAIEDQTASAVHSLKHTLRGVAAERIRVELAKLLCGGGAEQILRDYHDVITCVLPQLAPMVGHDQRTPFHRYDVWEHSIRAVAAVPPTEALRLTMLLHDSGKPAAFTVDEKGVGHAWGHQKLSKGLAEEILSYLKVDNATRDRVLLLVEHHDIPITAEPARLRRRLNQFGEEALWQLIEVHRADNLAKGTEPPEAVEAHWAGIRAALQHELDLKPCFTLKAMAVGGADLIAAGMKPGKALGACLEALLAQVVEGTLPNERDALLKAALAWQAASSLQQSEDDA